MTMGMRKSWWRFGWHPTLRDGPGTVTFWAPGMAYSEEWVYLALGVWWLTARTVSSRPCSICNGSLTVRVRTQTPDKQGWGPPEDKPCWSARHRAALRDEESETPGSER